MSKAPKPKTENSRMTLAEYVLFTRRGPVEMNLAMKVKEAVIKLAAENIAWKKGGGMRADSKTPHMKPEFWDKAFEIVEGEN